MPQCPRLRHIPTPFLLRASLSTCYCPTPREAHSFLPICAQPGGKPPYSQHSRKLPAVPHAASAATQGTCSQSAQGRPPRVKEKAQAQQVNRSGQEDEYDTVQQGGNQVTARLGEQQRPLQRGGVAQKSMEGAGAAGRWVRNWVKAWRPLSGILACSVLGQACLPKWHHLPGSPSWPGQGTVLPGLPKQVSQSTRGWKSPASGPVLLPSELCASSRPTEGPALLSATGAALPSLAGGRQGAQGVRPFPRPARASACQASMGFLAPVP